MSQQIEVSINNQVVLQFDRQPRLAGKQRQFLDNMDEDMDQGIDLAGQPCPSPTPFQKAQYVAMTLMRALDEKDDELVAACCSYLGSRHADLKVIKTLMHGDSIQMELVF